MVRPLDGITVIDICDRMAGSVAAMILADNGAEVICIESTDKKHRDLRRAIWDREKKPIALDLSLGTDSVDLQKFEDLIRTADVLLDTCEWNSPLKSVLVYRKLFNINKGLIHTSITAYGRKGPFKDEPFIEDLVVSRLGVLDTIPSLHSGPSHLVHPIAGVGAALLASIGTVAALYARESTGVGRKVDTSLMSGVLLYTPMVWHEKISYSRDKPHPNGGGPFYSVMECSDGQWLQLGCIHQGFIDAAAIIMGLRDIINEPRFGGGRNPKSESARQELYDIVSDVIKTKPYDTWAKTFDKHDVPYAKSSTIEDAFKDPQILWNRMVTQTEDPVRGTVSHIGSPLKFSKTPGDIISTKPLRRGHNTQILNGPSYTQTRVKPRFEYSDLELMEPPLSGVKILEIANVIAGPAAGKIWTDLGADVVKLESLNGDISRSNQSGTFIYLNSNKRSISVDAKTSAGREVVQRLASRSDILLANMRPGATERIGVGEKDLKNINPDIIETHVTAFGKDGPYSHRAGVDPLAQAWTGMQRSQGGIGNPPVFLGGLAPTDFTGGALGALGGLIALFVRKRMGIPQRVDTNLLNAGLLLSLNSFVKYQRKLENPFNPRNQYGTGALHNLYETSTGWIYVAADEHHWPMITSALECNLTNDCRFDSSSKRILNDSLLRGRLMECFKRFSTDQWMTTLSRVGVPCAPVIEEYKTQFFHDPQALENDMIGSWEHIIFGQTKFSRNLIKFGDTMDSSERPSPLLGEDTNQILDEIGYTTQQIDDMYAQGIVKTNTASDERLKELGIH